ncbi:maleylacetoacetate isomerase [Kiloniella laminariae]|uniref:Maleylacetoacetate isomerase n=1 Tax=Kiloniella laminariae TaxID=454162 RepID=A0ABT4LG84_9PROT|nr:maleylacetoacetate isomerase [Kiloniella laminariae]MCZ4280121.1 maleylacetoacetate isomerase [Kiloniella laminariae]
MSIEIELYDYYRSSASYRVRIALELKNRPYQKIPINLKTGGHHELSYRTINPQGLVPSLIIGPKVLTQSMAILEYLEEVYPDPPLLPRNPFERAEVRSIAQIIACDIHPLNNLRVLNYLKQETTLDEQQVSDWYQHWVHEGFLAIEQRLVTSAGEYSYGSDITLADICLAPQVYNAKRFSCDLSPYPTLIRVAGNLSQLSAFTRSHPDSN